MKKLFLIFLISLFPLGQAEFTDSFVVKISPKLIKVTSPKEFKRNLSVIIENKSMVKILGKIEAEDGSYEKIVVIKSQDFTSVNLNIDKKKKLFFFPMSPPYQKIQLAVGQKAYEIPAKK